jgi:hypothetical protein
MRNYLAVMDVDPLAIEAHDRAEAEADTVHTITVSKGAYRIVKRSRVNNDLVTELPLAYSSGGSAPAAGEPSSQYQNEPSSSGPHQAVEVVKYLPPGNRRCASSASSTDGGTTHIQVTSTVETLNGTAVVCDTKVLLQEDDADRTVLQQTLVITNQSNHKRSKTVRYFLPVDRHDRDRGSAADEMDEAA